MLRIDVTKNIQSVKGDARLIVDAEIKELGIIGVYGNSGEGKSTLFNMIAGLTSPNEGEISFNANLWFSSQQKKNVPTQQRNVGYIFQENSLFPHFTVKENIIYAVSKDQQKDLDVEALLQQVEMSTMGDRYPHQLSGGQIQRIAIARALAQKAQIILMDEPFSALDLEIKQKLYSLIKNFQKEYQLMIVMVTHHINDILYLCDEVLWIRDHQATDIQSIVTFKEEIEKKISLL